MKRVEERERTREKKRREDRVGGVCLWALEKKQSSVSFLPSLCLLLVHAHALTY